MSESEEEPIINVPKKRARDFDDGENDAQSRAKMLIEDEAESDSDDNNSDDNNSDEEVGQKEKEDQNEYVADDFLVMPGVNDDEESEEETTVKEKKVFSRLKKKVTSRALDIEDQELIREAEEDRLAKLKAEQKADESEEEEDDEGPAEAETGSSFFKKRPIYEEESDVDDFIVDDSGIRGSNEGEEEATQKARGNRERKQKKTRGDRDRATSNFASREQIEDVFGVFGDGFDDFDDEEDEGYGEGGGALDEEGEQKNVQSKNIEAIRGKFDRSTLLESFLMDEDDSIRSTDRAERLQSWLTRRCKKGDNAVNLTSDERLQEAKWVVRKIVKKMITLLPHITKSSEELMDQLVMSVHFVLQCIQEEHMEVPFIATYRKDYIDGLLITSFKSPTTPSSFWLWQILNLDEQYADLVKLREKCVIEYDVLLDVAEKFDRFVELSGTDGESSEQEWLAKTKADDLEEDSQKLLHIGELKEAFETATNAFQESRTLYDAAMDIVELESATEQDRQRVVEAEGEVERTKAEANQMRSMLEECETNYAIYQKHKTLRASFNPKGASELLAQMPYDKYAHILANCTDESELKALSGFISHLLQGSEADGRSLDAVQSAAVQVSNKALKKLRRATDRDSYRKLRRLPVLRQIANVFAASPCVIGEAVRYGISMKKEPPVAPAEDATSFVATFVKPEVPSLQDAEEILKSVHALCAMELAKEPHVRQCAMELFRAHSTISTTPTDLGLQTIHPFHELFGIHYLRNKHVSDFLETKQDRTLFLRLLKAQEDKLLTVVIDPPTIFHSDGTSSVNVGLFLHEMNLRQICLPSRSLDGSDDANNSWDHHRMLIVTKCIEQYLLPGLEQDVYRELVRSSRDGLLEEACDNFEAMVRVGPITRTANQMEHLQDTLLRCPNDIEGLCSVMSVFLPENPRDPLAVAFIDTDGVVRAHGYLPSEAKGQKNKFISSFISTHKPEFIAINSSGGRRASSMKNMLEKYTLSDISKAFQDASYLRQQEREENGDTGQYDDEDDNERRFIEKLPTVLVVPDAVPRLFMTSTRSSKMFPEFSVEVRAAISLARFCLEPLTEYCMMWETVDSSGAFGSEVLFLDLHPNKSLLSGMKSMLLRSLERVLVDVVCEKGVDINLATTYSHYAPLLAFVGGLGLRKSDALTSTIRRTIGNVTSRKELLERKLLGKVVYANAVGFLRVSGALLPIDNRVPLDPLDNTRIHPECYITHDFAPKICADSLDVQHNAQQYIEVVRKMLLTSKAVVKEYIEKPSWMALWAHGRPQSAVEAGLVKYTEEVKIVDENDPDVFSFENVAKSGELEDALFDSDLEKYAMELEKYGLGKRLAQMNDIKEELRFPWLDLRRPRTNPTQLEMFQIVTGETLENVHIGMKVSCKVTELFSEKAANCILDNGLTATVRLHNVTEERVEKIDAVLAKGMLLPGVIVNVDLVRMKVEVAFKDSLVSLNERHWYDMRYDEGRPEGDPRYDDTLPTKQWWSMMNRPTKYDRCFLEGEAVRAFDEAEKALKGGGLSAAEKARQQQEENIREAEEKDGKKRYKKIVRFVYHPLFQNCDYEQAEVHLGKLGAGSMIVRPSSKGSDYLTVSWCVMPEMFKHVLVEEKGKNPGDLGLGSQLCIKDIPEPFSDLDEIYARYIEPMNDYVTRILSHKSFLGGSPDFVVEDMKQKQAANPAIIPYHLVIAPDHPACFLLMWFIAASAKPVKKELVHVTPEGLRLREHVFLRVDDLLKWFKKEAVAHKTPAASQPRPQQQQPVHVQQQQQPVHVQQQPMSNSNANARAINDLLGAYTNRGEGQPRRPSRFSQGPVQAQAPTPPQPPHGYGIQPPPRM